jgi:hypothetical protein
MTGYESKRAAARDKLEDDDTQVYQAWRESASDYERGFIDGMQKQMQSSVDKAVNAMTQRPWVDLTDEEIDKTYRMIKRSNRPQPTPLEFARDLLTKFKENNNG